jgi:hypothetical protein
VGGGGRGARNPTPPPPPPAVGGSVEFPRVETGKLKSTFLEFEPVKLKISMVRVPLRGGQDYSRPPSWSTCSSPPPPPPQESWGGGVGNEGFTSSLNLKGDYTNLKLSIWEITL